MRGAPAPSGSVARGVRVLVILDGASEPLGAAATSLERAVTPSLDVLVSAGRLSRVRTVAPWLAAGSESAIPALLGWVPPSPVDRGMVEAAAREIAVPVGGRAWRVDVRDADDGARAGASAVRAAAASLADALPRHDVRALGGHRLLVVGEEPLDGLGPRAPAGLSLHLWPEGVVPPPMLDESTVVVAARGAAAGIARLMGARVVVPGGATGRPGSDLAAKARAACEAIGAGAEFVVVHVGAPDEAAHELDADAKVAAIEAADALLVAPLAAAVRAAGGVLRVCPDHGCDPATGLHDDAPVPCVEAAFAPRSAQAAPVFAESAPRSAPVLAESDPPSAEVAPQAAPGLAETDPSSAEIAPQATPVLAESDTPSADVAPMFAESASRSAETAPHSAQTAPRRLTERAVAELPVTDLAPRALVAA